MKKLFLILGIFVSFIVFSSCSTVEEITKPSCTDVWTHNENETGQTEWVNLCSDFNACGGHSQSPINIVTTNVIDSLIYPLEFDYHSTPIEIENNGHTIEFVCEKGSKLMIGNTEYELKQFHYHSQSEHQLNGNHFPLEVHFVHKASETDYAVVGVFFELGEENELLAEYLSHFPTSKKGVYKDSLAEIELAELLPEDKSFYHYSGSLTTPPCSEVVSWYVLKSTIEASSEQLSKFASILKNNYRYVQKLNERKVVTMNE